MEDGRWAHPIIPWVSGCPGNFSHDRKWQFNAFQCCFPLSCVSRPPGLSLLFSQSLCGMNTNSHRGHSGHAFSVNFYCCWFLLLSISCLFEKVVQNWKHNFAREITSTKQQMAIVTGKRKVDIEGYILKVGGGEGEEFWNWHLQLSNSNESIEK